MLQAPGYVSDPDDRVGRSLKDEAQGLGEEPAFVLGELADHGFFDKRRPDHLRKRHAHNPWPLLRRFVQLPALEELVRVASVVHDLYLPLHISAEEAVEGGEPRGQRAAV